MALKGLLLCALAVICETVIADAKPPSSTTPSAAPKPCAYKCAAGNISYQDPATGKCSCVKSKPCTMLCTLTSVLYTNPATGVCSCVPRCTPSGLAIASTAAQSCPTDTATQYNCIAINGDSSEGACVAVSDSCWATDCVAGATLWINPVTGLCGCVKSCPKLQTGNADGCPDYYSCVPAKPGPQCDIAGKCDRVCLVDGCLC
jgi:hypothetical protein